MEFVDLGEGSDDGTFIVKTKIPSKYIDNAYELLSKEFPQEKYTLNMAGREVLAPRLMVGFSVRYNFNIVTEDVREIKESAVLQGIIDWANRIFKSFLNGHEFNSALLNHYRNGEEYIGYHSDNTQRLYKHSPVFTLTLSANPEGEQRKFYLKNIKNSHVSKIDCEHGQVLIMGGKCQETHKHSVPKISGKRAPDVPGRISITLRCHRVDVEQKTEL